MIVTQTTISGLKQPKHFYSVGGMASTTSDQLSWLSDHDTLRTLKVYLHLVVNKSKEQFGKQMVDNQHSM